VQITIDIYVERLHVFGQDTYFFIGPEEQGSSVTLFKGSVHLLSVPWFN